MNFCRLFFSWLKEFCTEQDYLLFFLLLLLGAEVLAGAAGAAAVSAGSSLT